MPVAERTTLKEFEQMALLPKLKNVEGLLILLWDRTERKGRPTPDLQPYADAFYALGVKIARFRRAMRKMQREQERKVPA